MRVDRFELLLIRTNEFTGHTGPEVAAALCKRLSDELGPFQVQVQMAHQETAWKNAENRESGVVSR